MPARGCPCPEVYLSRGGTGTVLGDLRSDALYGWEPPGGGPEGALTHCVIHSLDIVESVPLDRRVPGDRILRVLSLVADRAVPNLFGTDLSGVELRADDFEWSYGSGTPVAGPAQALASIACGRVLPPGRLHGEAAARFTQR